MLLFQLMIVILKTISGVRGQCKDQGEDEDDDDGDDDEERR